MKRFWIQFSVFAVALALVAPLAAGDEKERDAKEEKDRKEMPQVGTTEGSVGTGEKSYREKINLVTRKPLRKTRDYDRDTGWEDGAPGENQRRNVIARKRTKPRRGIHDRWYHTLQTARGPVRHPK